MRRRVNRKLLLWSLAVLAGLSALTYVWHDRQLKHQAGALLRQADRAFEARQTVQAVKYLSHYLAFEPGDTAALAKYGEALDKLSASPQARLRTLLVFDQVLRRDPARQDIRKRFVDIAVGLQRFPDAIRHLEILSTDASAKPEWDHLLACCLEANGDYEKAVAAFERALAKAPHQLDSYVLLAELWQQRFDRPEEAVKVLEAMTKANAQSVAAHRYRAQFHAKYGAPAEAARAIERALAVEPTHAEALLTAAELAAGRQQFQEARRHLRQGITSHPQNEAFYRLLAALEFQAGRPADALRCLEAGVKNLPEAVDLRARLADALLDDGQTQRPLALIADLKKQPPAARSVDYLTVRLQMLRGEWLTACAQLERLASQPDWPADWASRIAFHFGRCYQEFGEPARQLASYRHAAALDPQNVAVQLALAEALLTTGGVADAIVVCRKLSRRPHVPPQTWLLLGRALLERNRRLSEEQRDWAEVEQALAKAAETPGDAVALAILRADIAADRQQAEQAFALLEAARRTWPKHESLWIAEAELLSRLGQGDRGLSRLDEARRELGDSPSLRRARVRHWAARSRTDALPALKQLSQEPNDFAVSAQIRLWRELAETFARLGDAEQAAACWRQLAERHPRDLASRMWLFDHALGKGQEQSAQSILTEIRRIEGDDGVLWRAGDARRLLLLAKRGDRKHLGAARQRVAEIHSRQPEWPRTALLQAQLDEFTGQHERAVEHYIRALQLGEREPLEVLRITQLLVNRRRYFEADCAVRILEAQLPMSKELARLAADVARLNRDLLRAVTRANQAVPGTSRDYREHLWLAEVLWQAGRAKDAAAALERARNSAARNPEVWVALVQHHVRTDQRPTAQRVLDEARAQLPADRLPLFLARAYEILGQHERAEALYRELCAERPDDFIVLAAFADFYRRLDRVADAQPLWRTLIEPRLRAPAEQVARARRLLATGLAQSGKSAALAEARDVLARNTQEWGQSLADERAAAFVLALQPAHRQEALRRLDDTLVRQPFTADELFLFTQICETHNDATRAEELMQSLLLVDGDNPQVLAQHIRMLLERGEADEARRQLARLQRLEPDSARTQRLRGLLGQS